MSDSIDYDSIDYEIHNVGGVEHASLTLKPGVNVLHGRNGAGKTSAMRAIVRAQGGEGDLEKRDGSPKGEVKSPGVQLSVNRVVRKTGEAELSLADVGPLSNLIDPGIKDGDAAARARIRALVELIGLSVDDASLETLCGNRQELLPWLRNEVREESIDDLMTAADKLRRHAHSIAREHEQAAERASGQAESAESRRTQLHEDLFGQPLCDMDPAEAQQQLVEASREYERMESRCEARRDLEAQQAKIRESMGERPDPESFNSKIEEEKAEVIRFGVLIEDLKEKLSQANANYQVAVTRRAALEEAQELARESLRKWEASQGILAQSPTGPAPEELPEIRRRTVGTAEEQLAHARLSADIREAEHERTHAQTQVKDHQKRASLYREFATQIPNHLARLLADAGADSVTVIDGRLHAIRNGQPVDWELRLSEGQRVKAALEIAAKAYKSGVVPIAGHIYAALDPHARQEFRDLALKTGLFILTEEPTDGELRIDHVGGEGAAA